MNHEHRQQFCMKCQNRQLDRENGGWACKLTGKQPEFEETCPDFKTDDKITITPSESGDDENYSRGWGFIDKLGIPRWVLGLVILALGIFVFFSRKEDSLSFRPVGLILLGLVLLISGITQNNSK